MPRRGPRSSAKGSSSANPSRPSAVKSNATKSMWWQDIRVIPRRSKKRAALPTALVEGGAGAWHAGPGKAPPRGHDSTRRNGGDSDVGERATGHDRPADPRHDRS